MGLPGSLEGKESACTVGDCGSIPGLGRSPGGGKKNLVSIQPTSIWILTLWIHLVITEHLLCARKSAWRENCEDRIADNIGPYGTPYPQYPTL